MTARHRNGEGFTAVIGGGGAMAIGISAGILMALKEAGLDVADAAAAIGTSAGSTVAADIQLGVPLDEIAARVCTDRLDDRDDDPAGDREPLATTRAWRSWPELGRRAIGSTWVLTRALSPVRVPLPQPPGILRRNFPARCCRSANRTTGPRSSTPRSGRTDGSAPSRPTSTAAGG